MTDATSGITLETDGAIVFDAMGRALCCAATARAVSTGGADANVAAIGTTGGGGAMVVAASGTETTGCGAMVTTRTGVGAGGGGATTAARTGTGAGAGVGATVWRTAAVDVLSAVVAPRMSTPCR